MTGAVAGQSLVDHHCHGIVLDPLDRPAFEALLTEAERAGPLHGSLFDTQVGIAVRAICAPLLDLPPFAAADAYLERRAALGPNEVGRRMLDATGIAEYLVDTGFQPQALTSPTQLAAYTGARAHEIVRLETTARGRACPRRTERLRGHVSRRAA